MPLRLQSYETILWNNQTPQFLDFEIFKEAQAKLDQQIKLEYVNESQRSIY